MLWLLFILMEELRAQNKKLKELQRSCEEELEKLKEVGKTHENEIDTLLKFNERLLGIIENQFNTATKNKISSDLQIISEINEGAPDFNPNNKLNGNAAPQTQPRSNFQQQDIEGFEDEDEEEIYNNQRSPEPSPPQQPQPAPKAEPQKDNKMGRLDRVYQMQHRDEEVSINLSNSIKNSNPPELFYSKREPSQAREGQQLQQLKDMIKQYRQQFVDNSSEYQQICEIIHNDLLNDLQQFRRIEQESRQFYDTKTAEISNLREEITTFQPISELVRVMRKVNVPAQTERLLHLKIISKYH